MAKAQIKQSPNDPRQLQYHVLSNGLPVLLVHQAGSEKSAAALTVNVGHFDDPLEREGLAHFLEHMLFLGSQRFPQPGALQQIISEYGGEHNAWTGTEHSQFYFDIQPAAFDQALCRFADMFIEPLFLAEYVEKERQAIEAEFSLKLKDDSRRIYQAHKETINPQHPFAKFSVGNAHTLADLPENSLRDAVSAFFKQQYSSQRMSLCLVGPQTINELLQLAEQHFSNLPNHLPAKHAITVPLYLPSQLGVQLNIKPHKSSNRLVMSFALPDIQPWYCYKLVSFLAHLLGDEGPGSLLATLKKQGWANQLSAGGGIDGSNYKDFTIAVELTHLGRQHYQRIVELTFAKIALLNYQPFPLALFAERQKLLKWSYDFYETGPVLDSAMDLALNMQHYPIEDVIFGDYRMDLPPQGLYQQLLRYFHSENMRLMLVADDVSTDQVARWYQTPYQIQPLAAEWLQQLNRQALNPKLWLAPANPYLKAELTLLAMADHMTVPEQRVNQPALSLWYKADTEFSSPKGHIFVHISLPFSYQTIRQQAACRLWVELLLDRFNQQLYPATTAGLNYAMHVHRQGLSIQTKGLSANQIALLTDILAQLTDSNFCPQRFAELKQQLCRHWLNSSKNKPVAKLFSQLSALLQPHNPDPVSLARALADLSYADFQHFRQQVWQQLHLEALQIGNWSEQDAWLLQQILENWLSWQDRAAAKTAPPTYQLQQAGAHWHTVQQQEPGDHAMVIYLAGQDKSAANIARFMLANHLLAPQYFQQLRTEQQLGYLVGTGYVPVNTLPGIAFYIQSPHHHASALYQATMQFFADYLIQFQKLSLDEFTAYQHGLISQLKAGDTSLSSRAKRFWLALGQQDYRFDLTTRILEALTQLKHADFAVFLHDLLAVDGTKLVLATEQPESELALSELNTAALAEIESEI